MKNLYKVSPAARVLKCNPQTLRRLDWLGLFNPRRDRLNNRLYSNEDLDELRTILVTRRPGRPRKDHAAPTPTLKRRKKRSPDRSEMGSVVSPSLAVPRQQG